MGELPGVSRDPLTPVTFLERTVRVFPQRTAVIHGELRWTYAELARQVGLMAGALLGAGVRAGDRVAILAPNTPWLLVAHFAMPLLQAPLVTINARLTTPEIETILAHSGARVLLVDPALALLVDPLRDRIEQIVEIPDGEIAARPRKRCYADLLAGAPTLPIASALEDEQTVISVNYTSGTTGSPKGVMYTHRGAYLNAIGQVGAFGLDHDTVFLWTLPMFHCNGWCMPWAITAAAGTHVCLRKIDPPHIVELIDTHGVTRFSCAPTVLALLASDPALHGRRFDPPLRIVTGGAPPSPTLLESMHEHGFEVTHTYGLTETYGPHTICEVQSEWSELSLGQRARLIARQGVPFVTAAHLRVVDDNINDVPADGATVGEVVMRGNNVTSGYYRDPEATAHAFRGGWFHSGDLGVMHPDGYVELKDRSKDIIISGGENISSIEVENVIYRHPDVHEVAVVAVPDDDWGEVPRAFVHVKPGTAPTPASIIAFARKHLAGFKCPKEVVFGELPKTSTGKVQKFKLRRKS